MMNSKCHGCLGSRVSKFLLIVGGLNWGLVGVGMLMGNGYSWNVVNILFSSMPTLEAVVYVLVGVAAVMKCFHCKCKTCMAACASCCSVDHAGDSNQNM